MKPIYITPTQKAFLYYKNFHAIKLHFTQKSYNIAKTKGQINLSEENFNDKGEIGLFKMLTKMYPSHNFFREVVVANVLKNQKIYPTFLITDEAKLIHKKWIAKIDFLYYNFENDLSGLMTIPFDEMFSTDGVNPPLIIKKYIDGTIGLETLTILLKEIYCNKLKDCFIFQEIYQLMLKYSYIMSYDIVKMKHVVSKVLKKWVDTQKLNNTNS